MFAKAGNGLITALGVYPVLPVWEIESFLRSAGRGVRHKRQQQRDADDKHEHKLDINIPGHEAVRCSRAIEVRCDEEGEGEAGQPHGRRCSRNQDDE